MTAHGDAARAQLSGRERQLLCQGHQRDVVGDRPPGLGERRRHRPAVQDERRGSVAIGSSRRVRRRSACASRPPWWPPLGDRRHRGRRLMPGEVQDDALQDPRRRHRLVVAYGCQRRAEPGLGEGGRPETQAPDGGPQPSGPLPFVLLRGGVVDLEHLDACQLRGRDRAARRQRVLCSFSPALRYSASGRWYGPGRFRSPLSVGSDSCHARCSQLRLPGAGRLVEIADTSISSRAAAVHSLRASNTFALRVVVRSTSPSANASRRARIATTHRNAQDLTGCEPTRSMSILATSSC